MLKGLVFFTLISTYPFWLPICHKEKERYMCYALVYVILMHDIPLCFINNHGQVKTPSNTTVIYCTTCIIYENDERYQLDATIYLLS